ncbi:hypothetical protein K7432_013417 [Basidiobolus ranarum]|uniref:Major facilitator superfamily (MFS) profile domain-containing protein n=1 Tax=Basidiobolus ranarum TaxID=34480 RepID=A0ABR2WJB1_9FUNG
MASEKTYQVKDDFCVEKVSNYSLDPTVEHALVRKIDKRLIPFLSLLYLCSFLDRVNIGNAKLAHIDQDLALTPGEYNWSLSIFFVGYVIFEVPSNIILKQIGPSRWIPIVMLSWAIVMMCMAAVNNASGLLACRFFLGLTEAGLFPGVIFYLSLWYTRQEQALRIALFFSAATIAGAFGGVLAYGIIQMDGLLKLTGWQWIFIIEGLPTLVLAAVSYFYLPDFPERASFLNEEERMYVMDRLKHDAGAASETHFSWKQCKDAFIDWKVYFHMIISISATIPLYSLSLFFPTIIGGMGFTNLTAQLMSAPPYAVACIFTILISFNADRKRERGLHIAALLFVGMIGYMLLILLKDQGATALYISAVITTIGVFANIPIMVSWHTNNIGGHTKRGIASALIIAFSNIGGGLGGQVQVYPSEPNLILYSHISQIYRVDDAPYYTRGHTICMLCMGLGCISTLLFKWLLIRENRRREELTPAQYNEECSQVEPADWHPDFRYIS